MMEILRGNSEFIMNDFYPVRNESHSNKIKKRREKTQIAVFLLI